MPFTRSFLRSQGCEKEQVDAIMDAHTEVTDALKAERDQYKEEASKLEGVQKELDDLKAKGFDEDYKEKYEQALRDLENYKADVSKEKLQSAREAEAKKIMKELKIPEKYFDKIVKYSSDEISSIKIDEDGKVTGTGDFKKAIETDWSDYLTEEGKKGAETATPPSGNISGRKGKTYSSRDEVMAIKDAAERQQAIADNHELFNL